MTTTTNTATTPTQMQELHIVDAQGRPRLVLSATSGTPSISLLHSDGSKQASVALDAAGLASIVLGNPNPAYPTAKLEVDAKGTHLKMDHPSGATCYAFVNNSATCGLVMEDTQRKRRIEALVPPEGEATIRRLDDMGNAVSWD